MSRRGSFSRSVARAAASGGGRTYGNRRPNGWYLLTGVIVAAGIALVVYSRQEKIDASNAAAASTAPGASANWQAALSFDICGTMQPALAPNTNLSTAGVRTFGDGVINIDPGAVSKPANFEGKKANLGTFVSNYTGLTLTADSLQLPGKTEKLWRNGDRCTSAVGPATGVGELQIKEWSSPTGKGALVAVDPSKIRFENGEMLTVAFVPKGTKIPEPSSKSALLAALGKSSTTPSTAASVTTTTVGVATTNKTSASSTLPKATATTTAPASSSKSKTSTT